MWDATPRTRGRPGSGSDPCSEMKDVMVGFPLTIVVAPTTELNYELVQQGRIWGTYLRR